MTSPAARVLGLALLGLAAAALVAPGAAAHANHVEADAQTTSNDTVLVEGVLASAEGWVVVRAVNASGDLGEPLGHVRARPDAGWVTDVPVAVERPGNGTDGNASAGNASVEDVAVALHREGGGAGFDLDDDPVQEAFGEPVAARFPLERGEADAYVGARTFAPVEVEDGNATVRRVDAPAPGHVVLRSAAEGNGSEAGAVLGSAPVPAGTTRNASVPVDRPASAGDGEAVRLEAALLRDDGDGAYGASDAPVTAGGTAVASTLSVAWPAPGDATPPQGYGNEVGNASGGNGAPGPGLLVAVAGLVAGAAAVGHRR